MGKYIAMLAVAFLYTTAAFSQYLPTLEDISLISHKNELRIGTGITMLAPVPLSSTTTITYGFTDDFAIQCHGITSRLWDIESDNYFHGASGAVGKYKQFENQSIVELYMGTGYGSSHFSYVNVSTGNETDLTAVYMQYFLKINYGKTGKGKYHFERGVSMKCEFSDFRVVDHYVSRRSEYYKKRHIAVEPSLYSALGGEKFKVGAILGGVIPLEIVSNSGKFDYEYLNFAFTLNYRLQNN